MGYVFREDELIDILILYKDGYHKVKASSKMNDVQINELASRHNISKCPSCSWWNRNETIDGRCEHCVDPEDDTDNVDN